METMTDKQAVLAHLETHGSITPKEALERYGIMRLGARIFDLRMDGHNIESQPVGFKARSGRTGHYVRYVLRE